MIKISQRTLFILIAVVAFGVTVFALATTQRQNVGAQPISPGAYQSQFTTTDTRHLLLDVRTPQEFASGHIPGAVNISVETLASRLNEVQTGQPIVVYCRSGNRSAQAAQILASAGYSTLYDLGGIIDWQAQGFPIQ
jgi:rhodanese-related sulfurtransferase